MFRSDGSWAADGDGSIETTVGLRAVVRARRATSFSPAKIASMIRNNNALTLAFPDDVIEAWDTITDPSQWAFAVTRNTAQEFVKREGYGSKSGRWRGPRWAPSGEGPAHVD